MYLVAIYNLNAWMILYLHYTILCNVEQRPFYVGPMVWLDTSLEINCGGAMMVQQLYDLVSKGKSRQDRTQIQT